MPRTSVDILGVPIDFLDMATVETAVVEAARERRFFQIATVNLDFLVNSGRDPEVREVLRTTSLNVADGAPVAWAGRLLRCRRAQRLAGADLVPELIAEAARSGLRVFLLGGEDGTAAEAAHRLTARHPDLHIGYYEPPIAALEELDDAEILERVRTFDPAILFVALGHPKQDKWIHRHADELPMVAMGIGCSLDLIAGRRTRAPAWAQRLGLEWSYRLLHEPRRLVRRYSQDGVWALRALLPWIISERIRLGVGGSGPT